MAHLGQTFDIADIPEQEGYSPIPDGWYRGQIQKADLRDTKSGGKMIALGITIIGEKYAGRMVWANINIRNPSAEAERIGQQQLGSVLRAIGLAKVGDTDELIGGSLEFKAATEEYQGEKKNSVKGFRAIQGSAIPTPKDNPFKQEVTPDKPIPFGFNK